MRYTIGLLIVLLVLASQPGCIRATPAQTPAQPAASGQVARLRAELDKLFSDPLLAQAQIDVEVFSIDRSEVLYARNPQQLFIPASTNKLITAAVALLRLGPEYCFETRILTDGRMEGGVLRGNLILVGSGDPSQSPEFNNGDPFAVFKNWASKLKGMNVRAISGAILGDDGAFRDSAPGLGWEWDDLPRGYAARPGALQFNDNVLSLQLTPAGEKGSPAVIRASPLENYLDIENQTVTGRADDPPEIQVKYGGPNEKILVRGTVPEKKEAVLLTVAVRHPSWYYLSALNKALSDEGIRADRWDVKRAGPYSPPGYSLLWIHASPPLSEIVRPLLKNSQNLYAETLARELGLALRSEGTFAKGKEVVEETMTGMGIPKGSYSYADGSGLSRQNLESADSFVRLLRFMRQQRSFQVFYDALPIAGVDGTLSARMKKTSAENRVHAKTGSMTNVSCIAGYVKTADGELLAFCAAVNNSLAGRDTAESVQDKALERLASFSRR